MGYLEGDQEALEQHCGEAAFAAVNASIKARLQQKLMLDTAILDGPTDIELKGAKLMEKGAPCFIWTFNMQQVNCLRNSEGEIIEGAVDDIRTVCYAMAVTKHPDIDVKLDLQYPWQISELAQQHGCECIGGELTHSTLHTPVLFLCCACVFFEKVLEFTLTPRGSLSPGGPVPYKLRGRHRGVCIFLDWM